MDGDFLVWGTLKSTVLCQTAHWPLLPFLLNCTWKLLHLLSSPEFAVLLPTIPGENHMGNTTSSVCIKLLCVYACVWSVHSCVNSDMLCTCGGQGQFCGPGPLLPLLCDNSFFPLNHLHKISQLTVQTGIPSTQVPGLPEWVEAKLSNFVRSKIEKSEAYK